MFVYPILILFVSFLSTDKSVKLLNYTNYRSCKHLGHFLCISQRPLISIYKLRFQDSYKICTWLCDLIPKLSRQQGFGSFFFFFFPLMSSILFSWPSMAVFQNFLEKSCLDSLSMPSFSSYSNLLLQNGWLYCKLRNKQVLSGCTLFSLSLYLFPLSCCPFPSPQHFISFTISCLFILAPVLFLQFQSNPNPTHFQSNCHQ